MPEIGKILSRFMEISGARSDSAIAKALGVTPQAIGNSRKRGAIPYEKFLQFAERNDISLDYLLLGKGGRDKATDPIDEELFNEVVSALASEESELRKVNYDVFCHYAVMIYNQAHLVTNVEERTKVIASTVRMLSISTIKNVLTNIENWEPSDPEHKNKLQKVLNERINELEIGMEAGTSTVQQTINGENNQVAGRDITNPKNKD